ncbi:tryptophan transporter [Clostridium thermarum]|uniref:tryptophan transporter n=1 Tax=Clostridium thermarum TaxID=1716543 RepID=UPI0013D2F10B|nr:tryptophan transporter [Clostridium thermarum]
MNTRKLTLSSILLAIGLALHYMIPGTLGAMKPDTLLSMMFIAILICDDYKSSIAIGTASGILTALTTTFPGGQAPNVIDKIITAQLVFLLVRVIKKFHHQIRMFVLAIIGTLISGTIFLSSALVLVGLPAGTNFIGLFLAVVLPAAAVNTALCILVYNILHATTRRTSYNLNR